MSEEKAKKKYDTLSRYVFTNDFLDLVDRVERLEDINKPQSGVRLIEKERQRQIDEWGWTQDHVEHRADYELSGAAICYAIEARREGLPSGPEPDGQYWMWDDEWWKPSRSENGTIRKEDSIRMLEKAGALIAAEIDRLLL